MEPKHSTGAPRVAATAVFREVAFIIPGATSRTALAVVGS